MKLTFQKFECETCRESLLVTLLELKKLRSRYGSRKLEQGASKHVLLELEEWDGQLSRGPERCCVLDPGPVLH